MPLACSGVVLRGLQTAIDKMAILGIIGNSMDGVRTASGGAKEYEDKKRTSHGMAHCIGAVGLGSGSGDAGLAGSKPGFRGRPMPAWESGPRHNFGVWLRRRKVRSAGTDGGTGRPP